MCWIVLGSAISVHAQQAQGTFEVPCQTREAFVSRLRALVQVPESADSELSGFEVEATESAPKNWLISVRIAADGGAPRSLRDTSCEAVVEAGALVVALWINELAAARGEVPASPDGKSAPLHMIVVQPASQHTFGFSLLADGSTVLFRPHPGGGLGSTLMVWLQDEDREFGQVGVRIWPDGFRMHPSLDNAPEQHSHVEVLLGGGSWWRVVDGLDLGAQIMLLLGGRTADSGAGDSAYGVDVSFIARWRITPAFALRYHFTAEISKDPMRMSLMSALGLDVHAFDF